MIDESSTPAFPSVARSPLVVRAVELTDVGKVRSENQDFAIMMSAEEEAAALDKGRLMVVADGMGGHRGGATASRLAATTIKAEYLASDAADVSEALEAALVRANEVVYAESVANPDLRGMGTTCSALVIRDGIGYFAHVGDSRIYRLRDGAIAQLTEDHSLVASMVREGLLTAQEAEVHPRRNVLQRSMGVSPEIEVDLSAPFDVCADDVFILCSDGLHGLVREEEMLELASRPVDAAARDLVRLSMERGAPDNVTVIVARVEEASEEKTVVETSEGTATVEPSDPLDETQPYSPPSAPASPSAKTIVLLALFWAGLAAVAITAWLMWVGRP